MPPLVIRDVKEGDKIPSSFKYDKERFSHLVYFFNSKAYSHKNQSFSRTLVGLDKNEGKIISFVTLLPSFIRSEKVLDFGADKFDCPSLLIGKLLVDEQHQRCGVGKSMVSASIGIANRVNDIVACRFVMVHSHFDAEGFYRNKMGFKEITRSKKNITMVFDLLKSK